MTGVLFRPRPDGEGGSVFHPERRSLPHRRASAFVLALTAFLFAHELGRRELYSSHEARAAQNAQRMLDTGEYALPVMFDGQTDLQKPPGYYWLVAAVGRLGGGEVTAWAARVPAAAAGLITVMLVFACLRHRPAAAVVAAVTMATACHFTAIARTARIDMPLTAAAAGALFAFVRGCQPGCGRPLAWHLLSATSAAVAVLLKGPVGLALIGPVAVAWLLVERRANPLGERPRLPVASAVLGPLVVAGLALPWFLWADRATGGEFLKVFFWHHNVERFAGTSPTLAAHPWWYYAPRFAADFLPWSPALAALAVWGVRNGLWRADPAFRLGVVWFATMAAVLSLAKFKRADYLLPAYPGAALALGAAAAAWWQSRTDPTRRRAAAGFALAVAGVLVGWQVMIRVVEPLEEAKQMKRPFAAAVRAAAPAPGRVLLFRVESHPLTFHLGRPVHTLVEWNELRDLLAAPGPHVVVVPADHVYACGELITARRLTVLARLEDYTAAEPPRPLVALRTVD